MFKERKAGRLVLHSAPAEYPCPKRVSASYRDGCQNKATAGAGHAAPTKSSFLALCFYNTVFVAQLGEDCQRAGAGPEFTSRLPHRYMVSAATGGEIIDIFGA